MVYTRTMLTALLASGAAFSVVVSAVPIDMNSGRSLVTTMASSRTSSSSSTSIPSAAPSTLFDNAIDSDDVLDPLGPASLSQPLDRVPLKFEHQRRAPSVRESTGCDDGANGREAGQGQNPSSSSQHDVNGEPSRHSSEEELSPSELEANQFLDNLAEELGENRLRQPAESSTTTQSLSRLMLTDTSDRVRDVQTVVDHSSDVRPGANSVFQSDQVSQQATHDHPSSNNHWRRAPSGEHTSYEDFWNGYDDEEQDPKEVAPSYRDSEEEARQRRLEEEEHQRKLEEQQKKYEAEKKRQEEAPAPAYGSSGGQQTGEASGSQGASGSSSRSGRRRQAVPKPKHRPHLY
ncbi:hypothetical protein FB446DRAFT_772409 [Lentinula raphanica]|nr:hypothetical protein FB446DRAFT_772409 [Lentinula raphanica]